MRKIIDMPDFLFINLLFLGLFLLTKNNIKLLSIMVFFIFFLVLLLIFYFFKYLITSSKR